MRETLLSNPERDFVLKCLAKGMRLDKREAFDFRPIKVEFGKDLGYCIVDLGNTKVMAQVSAEIDRPRESRPSEGRINIHVEMSQMASPSFNPGKPGDIGIALQRILERGIVVSKAVDLEELCIRVSERVWKISVHVHILSHDGNLLDCACIAAITALAHFRRPDVSVVGKDVTIHTLDDKQPLPLIMNHYPFCVSFGLFNTGDLLLLDPSQIEEKVMDGKLMISMNRHREVCCMQMSGNILVNKEQVMRCTNIAYARVKELTEFVKKALENDINEKKLGEKMSMLATTNIINTESSNHVHEDEHRTEESSSETNEEMDTSEKITKKLLNKKSDKGIGDGSVNTWVVDDKEIETPKTRKKKNVTMNDSDDEEETIVMQQSDVGVFVNK